MNHEQAQTNLELVLDWIDALRRGDIDALVERFHPDVAWEDVAGGVACDGREQVLAWLRAAPSQPTDVDALELLARSSPESNSTASCTRSSPSGLHPPRRPDRAPARPRPPRGRARRGRARRLPMALADRPRVDGRRKIGGTRGFPRT
jgi:SnoaL-like domain